MLNTMFHLVAKIVDSSPKAKHEYIDEDLYVDIDNLCFEDGHICHFVDGFSGSEEIHLSINGQVYKWILGKEPTKETIEWITWAADWLLDN